MASTFTDYMQTQSQPSNAGADVGGGMPGSPSQNGAPPNYGVGAVNQGYLNQLYQGAVQASNQPQNAAGNYLMQQGGTTWMRPYGGDNTSWMYGQNAPTAGVDQRAWANIYNPNAFQYGGQVGGAQAEEGRYANMGQQMLGNKAPQIDLSGYQQDIEGAQANARQQDQLVQQLQDQMSGRAPSLAESQMQQGLQNAYRQQATIAGSARGGGANLAAAQGQAAQAAMGLQSNAISQGAQARLQEQLNAEQQYGQLTTNMRAQQLQQAQMTGGFAGQQAQLGMNQNQLNQQGLLALEAMRQGVFQQQMSGQMGGEAQNSQNQLAAQQLAWQQQQADAAMQRQIIGGLITGAATVGGAAVGGPAGAAGGAALGNAAVGAATSDVRAKQDIRPAGSAIDATLGQMGAYAYQYNRPDLPPGQQVGTMAQQLQRSPAGAQMVAQNPQTGQLEIQGPQATNFSLAALARLNERLAALEAATGHQAPTPKPPALPSWTDAKRADEAATKDQAEMNAVARVNRRAQEAEDEYARDEQAAQARIRGL